jgi:type IV pilus assembly protein PilN
MPRINLLPWREERRRRREKQFKSAAVGIVVLAILVVGLWHHAMQTDISYQDQRNQYLKSQIARVDKRIQDIKKLKQTRKDLLARMRIIEQLQQSRPQVVHLFDQLVRTLPDGIYLTSANQKNSTLNLKGVAQSSARISTYMRNIDDSDWLADPNLSVIKSEDKNGHRRKAFTLNAQVTSPSTKKDKG